MVLVKIISQIKGLQYKLHMMGIPIDGPTSIFCDNKSVFCNATIPESTLTKEHNAIAYHCTCEAQVAGICQLAWENTETNLADLSMKTLPRTWVHFLGQQILW